MEGCQLALEDNCKNCNKYPYGKIKKIEPEPELEEMYIRKKPYAKKEGNQICSKCNDEKPLNYFYPGHRVCKDCGKRIIELKKLEKLEKMETPIKIEQVVEINEEVKEKKVCCNKPTSTSKAVTFGDVLEILQLPIDELVRIYKESKNI